ncbi:hypothetical protein F0562_028698 [Nyssa sinensis]|uniref:Uncharacterized protein n=1 Tax=Nyssa sinensis TaxID=561372 RepID=A0A5J5B103_9ASTE|nr:hypothetical protein F0562_028698 [Nyssa sinensis]
MILMGLTSLFSGLDCVLRKLPSPGFQVEVVLVDFDGIVPTIPKTETAPNKLVESSATTPASVDGGAVAANPKRESGSDEKDDLFSDSEAEESRTSKTRQAKAASQAVDTKSSSAETSTNSDQITSLTCKTEQVSEEAQTTHKFIPLVSRNRMPLEELFQARR